MLTSESMRNSTFFIEIHALVAMNVDFYAEIVEYSGFVIPLPRDKCLRQFWKSWILGEQCEKMGG